MKRKATLLTVIGLIICLIVGIIIYVNAMKRDSKNGMYIETQEVTPTGATLCLEWKNQDTDSTLSLSDKYQIEKLTFLGWKWVAGFVGCVCCSVNRCTSACGKKEMLLVKRER